MSRMQYPYLPSRLVGFNKKTDKDCVVEKIFNFYIYCHSSQALTDCLTLIYKVRLTDHKKIN